MVINSVMQITVAVLESYKICHFYKKHLWKERKSKAQGITLYVSNGFLTMICMYAFLFLMQKAYLHLLLFTSWSSPSLRCTGSQEAALPHGAAQTMWHGVTRTAAGWVGYGRCFCGSAPLQSPEDQSFAKVLHETHSRAEDELVIRELNNYCSLGQERLHLMTYTPKFKHNFQFELIISSTCMYSLV